MFLEPEEPIEAKCTECGEVEKIEHLNGAEWKCLHCGETFNDISDDMPTEDT